MTEQELLNCMDGEVWAKEFVARFGGDEDLMRSWFQNAIMCGYDHGTRRGDADDALKETLKWWKVMKNIISIKVMFKPYRSPRDKSPEILHEVKTLQDVFELIPWEERQHFKAHDLSVAHYKVHSGNETYFTHVVMLRNMPVGFINAPLKGLNSLEVI